MPEKMHISILKHSHLLDKAGVFIYNNYNIFFGDNNHMERISILQKELTKQAAILLYGSAARYYFSATMADDALMLITKQNAYYFTDSRYVEAVQKQASGYQVLTPKNRTEEIIGILKKDEAKTVYCDISEIDALLFFSLQKSFKQSGITLSTKDKFDKLIKLQRSVKSEYEIEKIKSAQKMTELTLDYILPRITVGRSEREIALEMEFFARKLGSEGVAFDFIVASGENSSMPHAVPSDRKFKNGDFITMDFGCVAEGYRSDMTRTVALGAISDKQKLVYDTVLCAGNSAIAEIEAGKRCCDIDLIARNIIKNAGFGDNFGHALGHGVGIDIHEAPTLSPKNEQTLQAGNIVTVEPGIYLEGEFGVRIEDMILVTDTGFVNLTNCSRELIIL